jgi:hypothetical protein
MSGPRVGRESSVAVSCVHRGDRLRRSDSRRASVGDDGGGDVEDVLRIAPTRPEPVGRRRGPSPGRRAFWCITWPARLPESSWRELRLVAMFMIATAGQLRGLLQQLVRLVGRISITGSRNSLGERSFSPAAWRVERLSSALRHKENRGSPWLNRCAACGDRKAERNASPQTWRPSRPGSCGRLTPGGMSRCRYSARSIAPRARSVRFSRFSQFGVQPSCHALAEDCASARRAAGSCGAARTTPANDPRHRNPGTRFGCRELHCESRTLPSLRYKAHFASQTTVSRERLVAAWPGNAGNCATI